MTDKISVNDLARLRKIIFLIVDILENNINNFSTNENTGEKDKKLINFLMGEKENVVSILTKLINSLIKVIPLEEKFSPTSDEKNEKLSDDDMEILKRYIDKCNFIFNKSTAK